MTSTLSLKDICKSFANSGKELQVIKKVNLELNRGEIVALIGPSGSGKTTLLQIAGLLDLPNSGSIKINQINCSKADDSTRNELRKKHIGFIFQFHHLLPEFSAIENIMLPLLVAGIPKKEAREKSEEILSEIELSTHKDYMPAQLSGGQQQRVAIGRAIAAAPSVILADEPTGNLDSELAIKIFNLLKKMVKDHNLSCLLVTHNQEIAKKCDRVLKIKDGEIK